MHKLLAVILGVFAFLAVCVYWLVQMATGEPALPLEDVALRALLAMLVTWAVGLLLGRLGVAVISEAWHEAQARMTDRAADKATGQPGPTEAGGPRRK
jgi:NhaP-type Na+/H+ or K+/H+ antiporter